MDRTEDKAVIELSSEVLRVIEEFENASIHITQSDSIEHPESSVSEQQRFLNQLKSLLGLWTGNHYQSLWRNRQSTW